jgi:hypothetical protein
VQQQVRLVEPALHPVAPLPQRGNPLMPGSGAP